MTREEFMPSDEIIAARRVEYKEYGLVYYTPFEELLNALTHGAGLVFGIIGMIFMLLRSTTPSSYATSVLVAFGFIVLYGCSTTYHAVTDVKAKSIIRRFDHSSVNFVIISCGVSMCLLTSGHVYNYVALAMCYLVTAVNFVLCFVNLEKFKAPSFISNFVTAAFLFSVYILNRTWFSLTVKLLYLLGCVLCVIGASIFGIKKKYVHTIFHLFTLAGTIVFFFVTYAMLS